MARSIPVSVLISPTILGPGDREALRDAGADRIGVAIDLATQALFDQYLGKGRYPPHPQTDGDERLGNGEFSLVDCYFFLDSDLKV